ncbi:MAG: methyltransferase domain-containing protein [Polyangiaceae bacterium]|nr:methyltransferase domain-containing protein [Polyangiaceae bacterium]
MIGIDANEELLARARARDIPNAEFRCGNLKTLEHVGKVDGIWCSFAPAYIPELAPTLAAWKRRLNPGGWVALIETDNLFGHEPLSATTSSLLDAYAQAALQAGWYDFHMGSKLLSHLERAGYTISDSRTLSDRELSFDGPAEAEVLEAWKARLERMNALKTFCGTMFEQVRTDLLAALSREDHRSLAKVYSCIATS